MVRQKIKLFLLILLVHSMKVISAVPEKVVLITDRSLYVSSEKIIFAATVWEDQNIENNYTSHQTSIVLYVELISPDGKSIGSGKFEIIKHQAWGTIKIPPDLVTGYYIIRAYTRNMRNFGPKVYASQMLKIINPYRNEVLTGTESKSPLSDSAILAEKGGIYSISLATSYLLPGQTVNLNLVKHDGDEKIISSTLSIIPHLTSIDQPAYFEMQTLSQEEIFCPESNGISVSGLVRNQAGGTAGQTVNLSIIGNGQDFMATTTDQAGRYYFLMPEFSGVRDIYLSLSGGQQDMELLVDNDFCNIPASYKTQAFTISEDEKKLVLSLAANVRISDTYSDSTLKTTEEKIDNSPFYGIPDQVLILEKFIQLPTLEEYFNELPGYVKVRTINGRKYFKVLGLQPEMTTYDPLVLVDHVAVPNHEKVLEASPLNIARIDMISRPYVKGDNLYGGIISIISKKGDFAGIELPASGTFINYRFFQIVNPPVFEPEPGSPDARNTVLFKHDIENYVTENKSLSFVAPATPGAYEVRLTSINIKGEKLISRKLFEVSSTPD